MGGVKEVKVQIGVLETREESLTSQPEVRMGRQIKAHREIREVRDIHCLSRAVKQELLESPVGRRCLWVTSIWLGPQPVSGVGPGAVAG